ncbi:MAG TPA: carboxypeptidase-like regulatory domain-containing protein [Candidatus Cybelea sp.]|nr:carboxypeptidase-like regulatory domain-containing protein [Candidatus Cybelea sp.]
MAHRLGQVAAFVILLSLCLLPGFAWGQARTEGQLSGVVVDQSGATLPNATLVLDQPSTGFHTVVTSTAAGAYAFPDVQPGSYTLTADAKGFATKIYNTVVVYAGRTTDLRVELRVGTVTETVAVSAQAEVLETSSNTLATTVTGDAIQDLPLNGRDALPFAQLMPGAQVGGDQRFTTYDALPNGAINISIDGTNDNFSRFRTSTTGFFTGAGLRIGAVDEMTVSTDQLTADAAAEGAITINVTTKHGTNAFHGNGFWETYNSAFDANSFQNNMYLYDARQIATVDPATSASYLATGRKQPFHINDYGGSLGGPIKKDKLFFFFNFEQENVPSTSLQTTGVLSTAAQGGSFTYARADNGQTQTVSLYNIAAANGYPSVINSAIQSLFSTVNGYTSKGSLAPNTTDTLLSTLQNNLTFPYNSSYKQYWPSARVDFLIRPNITWHVSDNIYWRTYAGVPIYPGDSVLQYAFQSTYSTFATGLDWTISPRLVNQINFGVLNEQEEFQAGNSFKAFQGITYLPSPSSFGSPGSTSFTPPVPDSYSILPEPRNSPVRNVTDNVTWTHATHTITFGGEFRYASAFDTGTDPPIAQNLGITSLDPAATMFNTAPVAGCTADTQGCFPGGLGTANNNEAVTDAEALYSLLTGRISSISGSVPLNTLSKPYAYTPGGITHLAEEFKEGGFYVQDAWKVTTHLAINYGLRLQFTGPLVNTNNYFTGPTYAALLGPSSGLFQPGALTGDTNPQITLRPQPYGGDFKQPAPRLGFAWNPDIEDGFLGKLMGGSKTVIRGGYAINYYNEGTIPWENVATGGLASESYFFYQGSGPGLFEPGSISFNPTSPAVNSINSFPNTGGQFVTPLPESEFTFTGLGSFSTVNPNIKSPYVQNWSLGVQRELPGNWVVEFNYVGNHSVHMWDSYDLNEVNIFQNASGFDSFLQDFKYAQGNLALNNALPASNPYSGTFAYDPAVPGETNAPILSQAFGPLVAGSPWSNPGFLFDVQTGQAGALAGAITQNYPYFCNLVANTFSPCVLQGYVASNQAPTPLAYPINFFQVNPYGGGNALEYLSDPGSESYEGLHINVKHPVGHGLNFMADYAYSHAFTNRYLGDYYSADSALADFYTLRDPALNHVPSPYDLRHTFNTFFTYALPFGPGHALTSNNGLLNRVIGGWTLGSIFSWQIGRNFKLAGGQDTYNWFDSYNVNNYLGYPPDPNDSGVVLNGVSVAQLQSQVGVHPSPTITDNGVQIPNPTIQALGLPSSLFGPGGAVQPESTPGELGQIVFLHGPMFVNTNFSLTKHIPIWERVGMDIHAEFINLFNHPNFNYTDGYSFGSNNPAQYLFVNIAPYSALSTGQMQTATRVIQFRLQLVF